MIQKLRGDLFMAQSAPGLWTDWNTFDPKKALQVINGARKNLIVVKGSYTCVQWLLPESVLLHGGLVGRRRWPIMELWIQHGRVRMMGPCVARRQARDQPAAGRSSEAKQSAWSVSRTKPPCQACCCYKHYAYAWKQSFFISATHVIERKRSWLASTGENHRIFYRMFSLA